ncbi:MAG: hypothetical protein ABGY11_05825 [Candidatus Thioglobus sp.]
MFKTIFTIVCMSIFVTSVFAQNKLTPTVYTSEEFHNKYSRIKLSMTGDEMVSAAIASSAELSICKALAQVAIFFAEEVTKSEDGLSIISRAHAKIHDYAVTTKLTRTEIGPRRIKTTMRVTIEGGKDSLRCNYMRTRNELTGDIRRVGTYKGNIDFSNIQSKKIRVIDIGVVVEDQGTQLQLFIVLGIT